MVDPYTYAQYRYKHYLRTHSVGEVSCEHTFYLTPINIMRCNASTETRNEFHRLCKMGLDEDDVDGGKAVDGGV